MSPASRLFSSDEEKAKKDDEYRPWKAANGATWQYRAPGGLIITRRKIAYTFGVLLFIYLFIQNIPTDVGPHPRWADTRVFHGDPKTIKQTPLAASHPDRQKPPRPTPPAEVEDHYHDGPIKFYYLAVSLHAATKLGGAKELNKNVVFAASSLKSASEIIPLACEMSRQEKNQVHMIFMGRDDTPMSEIQQLNGAAEEDCKLYWHDARPDFSHYSSDFRMESSVSAALEHINNFMHPQVFITDDPSREDDFFVKAIRTKLLDLAKPLIELPPDAIETVRWITNLDSASLSAWPSTYIDILIQVPPDGSGSLLRLLRSIEAADFFGARHPHLTIELPAQIDPPTWRHLQDMVWPPLDWSGTPHASQLTLRHRVPRMTTSEEEATARLVESFYPKRLTSSHLLVLSPQVELSPWFYHYVFYSTLEYRHSHQVKAKDMDQVMGISLELPEAYLNDTTNFQPPVIKHEDLPQEQPPFLWQSPSGSAALYFSDKWMEFHSFMTYRIAKPPTNAIRQVSERHPAWLESLLEFLRVRGYFLMYPPLFANDLSLATVHDELYRPPEERSKKTSDSDAPPPELGPDQILDGDESMLASKPPPNTEHALMESASLMSGLGGTGALYEMTKMKLLSFDGHDLTPETNEQRYKAFSESFRRTVGQCGDLSQQPRRRKFETIDLFCNTDDMYDHHAASKGASQYDQHAKIQETPRHVDVPPTDHDRISQKFADGAKAELAAHLDRQGASGGKVDDQSAPAVGHMEPPPAAQQAQKQESPAIAAQDPQQTQDKGAGW